MVPSLRPDPKKSMKDSHEFLAPIDLSESYRVDRHV